MVLFKNISTKTAIFVILLMNWRGLKYVVNLISEGWDIDALYKKGI